MGEGSTRKWVLLLQELRLPFLTASLVPVLLGSALAYYQTGRFQWSVFFLALLGMALLHAGANVANDYFDHRSGNDEANQEFVRPFTGGSRLIQTGQLSAREVLTLAIVCFALGSVCGAVLALKTGWVVLALGAVGIVVGYFYTAPPFSLCAHGLGEPVVALSFGILPVLGAYYVQTRTLTVATALASIPVAILITAVLFINQFQDARADEAVGKRHWVVRLGKRRSALVYAGLMGGWMLAQALLVLGRYLPFSALWALVGAVPAAVAVWTASQYFDDSKKLAPANALTIVTHLLVGLVTAGALVMSR